MKLTREGLIAGPNCGAINARQLDLLGEKWPPRRGWKRFLAGKKISEGNYQRFLTLRKQKRQPQPPQILPDPSLDVCTIYF
jgi:hypothetical protein